MKILLERAGVHECGVDGVAEKALVYSCKFFWFFFNDCKKNMKKRMNFIRLNIKVKKFKNFPDKVLWTTDCYLFPSLLHWGITMNNHFMGQHFIHGKNHF